MGWGPNKIHYFTKFRFEYTTKIHHVENQLFGELTYDKFWEAQYTQDPLPKMGKPLPPNFQGKSKRGAERKDTKESSNSKKPEKKRRIQTLVQAQAKQAPEEEEKKLAKKPLTTQP